MCISGSRFEDLAMGNTTEQMDHYSQIRLKSFEFLSSEVNTYTHALKRKNGKSRSHASVVPIASKPHTPCSAATHATYGGAMSRAVKNAGLTFRKGSLGTLDKTFKYNSFLCLSISQTLCPENGDRHVPSALPPCIRYCTELAFITN